MVEEASASASASETLTQTAELEAQRSNEATITEVAQGGAESTCNNDSAEASAVSSDGDREKSLEFANELIEKGSKAVKDSDYGEATECFSRALEIRVAHFGELAPQCVNAYYKYGCALLYKAQEETDPLGTVPKKEGQSQQESAKNSVNGESSTASVSCNAEQDAGLSNQEGAADDGVSGGKDQDEDGENSDDADLAEADADEDETDLDLAWKMLDVARAIVEKHPADTMEKVDILSALAEVALEREDIETSLSDYQKALSILERLVEPDSRRIAELNFRICLCLEIGSKPEEAIPYCQKAISTCRSRVRRLMLESRSFSESTTSPSASILEPGVALSSNVTESDSIVTDKQAEIETLTELSGDLEKKLEDLQQLASNSKSILAEILGLASAKAKGTEKSESSAVVSSSRMGTADNNGGFDSPTVSTAHTNGASGVTHLGVVGRGVKRVLMNAGSGESSASKKPALDSSEDKGEGNAS
ncbi:NASP-related protein sim3-like [Malus sylvestris]|uniref:NASP-related protein sim3-like n=1 Tax=Malus sylvestris TaxID=3752 RepID=UPI0021AC90FA|nr:NASP-related protein sim3-like [Malus sylvestris]